MRSTALLACLFLLASGCREDAAPASPVRQSVESLTRELFVPLTADFEHDARELADALDALCRAGDDATLADAREAWAAASARFKQTEVIAFGPHTLSPWRLAARIDFWPARQEAIEAQLEAFGAGTAVPAGRDAGSDSDSGSGSGSGSGSDSDSGSDSGSRLGAAVRGLPVIEYLLFAGGDDAVHAAFDDVGTATPRCAYLRALGGGLISDARALHEAWSGPFARDLTLAAGPNELYASIREGFGEIINGLAFAVEGVRADKLGRAFGSSSATAHPDSVESRFARRSLDDALDSLRGVEQVFTGQYGEHQALGVGGLLRARGRDMDRRFGAKLAAARTALRAIDGPLDDAVVHDRKRVQAALDALDALLVFLQVDVTQALSVTVTFGAGDGD